MSGQIDEVEVARIRSAALEEAAAACEAYSEVNFEIAGDSLLMDPILSGGPATSENLRLCRDMQVLGSIHTAQAHAGKHLAATIRAAKERQS